MTTLAAGTFEVDVRAPCVMGILNVTSDSFSGDGRLDQAAAIAHGRAMLRDGARIVDVGGESTRPGATPIDDAEELRRVIPVIEGLAADGACISVDTSKPGVMREAIAAGASMINDVNALRAPGALRVVAASNAAVCLMHMQGDPATMQTAPAYADVVAEIRAFLQRRASACMDAGITGSRIVVDPGIGFGKTPAHNLVLLRRLDTFAALGFPLLVGISRKATLGLVTGRAVGERTAASVAAAVAAAVRGARILRVHDVRETVDALAVWNAIEPWPASGPSRTTEQ